MGCTGELGSTRRLNNAEHSRRLDGNKMEVIILKSKI